MRALAIPLRQVAIDTLGELAMFAEDERVRLAAAMAIADRSDGKPRLEAPSDEETPPGLQDVAGMSDAELERRMLEPPRRMLEADYTEAELVELEERAKQEAKRLAKNEASANRAG